MQPREAPAPRPTGRVAPHVLDSEAAVLSQVIESPSVFDRVNTILKPDYFYSEANRRIYEVLTDLTAAGKPIDLGIIANELNARGRLQQVGGAAYIASLVSNQPYYLHIEEHAKAIRDAWRVRVTLDQFHTRIAEGYKLEFPADADGLASIQTWLEQIENETSAVAHVYQDTKVEALGAIVRRVIEDRGRARERGELITGTETGFVELDKKMTGLHSGDTTVLAGRPGMGKTAFLVSLFRGITHRRVTDTIDRTEGALLFSLEMPREQMAMRCISQEAGVDFSAIRSGSMSGAEWSRVVAAAHTLQNVPIWIDDTAAITALDARSRIRKLQREIETGRASTPCTRLSVVAFDYLQLMKGRKEDGVPREQVIASLTRDLKTIAKDLNVHVIEVSQLNRAVENRGANKRPQLSDLRESGAIEQDADNVWFLYRPGYYDRSQASKPTEQIIAKQRNGPTCTIEFHFSGGTMKFTPSEPAYEDDYDDYDPPPP